MALDYHSPDRVSASPISIKHNGKEYVFAPVDLSTILGAATALKRSEALQAAEDMRMSNPAAKRDLQARIALRNITTGEVIEWFDTPDGTYWLGWQSLKTNHDGLTLKQVKEIPIDKIANVIFAINGLAGSPDPEKADAPKVEDGEPDPTGSTLTLEN